MNTSAIEQKLLEDRKYWQRVMDYMIEPASMDWRSNLSFDVAKKKVARIDRALKRIKAGTFGQCEKCSAKIDIDPQRLETLVNSDCHVCTCCAETIKTRPIYRHSRRTRHPAVRHVNYAMEPA
jgi:RNA polymerase-binding transcription factor DksA